jgi:hypothetical protein
MADAEGLPKELKVWIQYQHPLIVVAVMVQRLKALLKHLRMVVDSSTTVLEGIDIS